MLFDSYKILFEFSFSNLKRLKARELGCLLHACKANPYSQMIALIPRMLMAYSMYNCSPYMTMCFYRLLQHESWIEAGLPFPKLFDTHFSLYDEEDGEASLSRLASQIQTLGSQITFDQADKAYQSIGSTKDIRVTIGFDARPSSAVQIAGASAQSGARVAQMCAIFVDFLHSATHGTWHGVPLAYSAPFVPSNVALVRYTPMDHDTLLWDMEFVKARLQRSLKNSIKRYRGGVLKEAIASFMETYRSIARGDEVRNPEEEVEDELSDDGR